MPQPLRLAVIFALTLGIYAVAYYIVGGFVSGVLILLGLAVFWVGLKHYVGPKKRA